MSALLARVERVKLAHQLGVDVEELEPLGDLTAAEVLELRRMVTHTLFAPHEHRFSRMAALAKRIPATLAAKGSQVALGPLISARVAAVTDPSLAMKLIPHLSTRFLAEMAPHIDPSRVADIVRDMPADLLVEVGHRLIAEGHFRTLGAFVTCAPVPTAIRVVETAAPLDLLQVALYADDVKALDRVILALADDHLAAVLEAAEREDSLDDALALLELIGVPSRTKAVRIAAGLDEDVRDGLIRAVDRNQAWPALVPVLDELTDDDVLHVLDVPALRDTALQANLRTAVEGHERAEALTERLLNRQP